MNKNIMSKIQNVFQKGDNPGMRSKKIDISTSSTDTQISERDGKYFLGQIYVTGNYSDEENLATPMS